jgi:formate hydrogenlyase subunit 6/NADH:ubiquinone oxidoreductase subunit I
MKAMAAFLHRRARSWLLTELLEGMALTLRYMFKPPVTVPRKGYRRCAGRHR